MSMAQRFFLLFFAVALTLCFTNKAQACVFIGGEEPPCSAYWKAAAVFVGVVQDIEKVPREPGERFDSKLLLRFSVAQAYRGVQETQIDVVTTTGSECDIEFHKGEKWLVYGYRNPKTSKLEVWRRTSHYEGAYEDIAYIRSVVQGATDSAIYGGVYQWSSTAWEGIRIEIEGAGRKYKVVTDKDGKFRVFNVKPGKYLIRGLFPTYTILTGFVGPDIRQPSKIKDDDKGTVIEFTEEILAGRRGYIQFLVYPPR